jgi:hypothetical protein
MVIHRFCDILPFVALVRTCPHVINSIMQNKRLPPTEATVGVDWIRPTRTAAEGLRWTTLFLLTQLRKKYPYVTSWFLSRRGARAQSKAAF